MTFNSMMTTYSTVQPQRLAYTSSIIYQLQFIANLPTWWVNDQIQRGLNVLRFRNYAVGDQDSSMTQEMRNALRITTAAPYSPFALNYQDVIVQSMVDRMTLQSVEAPGSDAGTQWANDVYTYTRMDGLQSDVHEATVRDGDCGVMVDWDEGLQQVRYTMEEAYDGTQGMIFFYRSKSVPVMDAAVKIWQLTLDLSLNILTRCNIYYPDHVEKYFAINQAPLAPWYGGDVSIPQYSPASDRRSLNSNVIKGGNRQIAVSQPTPSAVIHFEPEEPIQWYTMSDGAPLGIPIIHFRNRGRQNYGYSEIKSSVPIQDATNRLMYSLVINAEYNGFPIIITRGFQAPAALRPGTIIEISPQTPMTRDEVADVNRVQGADMSAYIDSLKFLTGEMGKITRTPTPEFMQDGGKVSGESLKMREIGLIGKANRFMVKAGNSWEDVFMMANRIQTAYGNKQPPKVDSFKSIWRSPEIRDDTQVVNNALALRPVVGDAQTLRFVAPVMDLDEEEIQDILEEKQDETAGKLAALSSVPTFGAFNEPKAPDNLPPGGDTTPNAAVSPVDVSGAAAETDTEMPLSAGTAGTQEATT